MTPDLLDELLDRAAPATRAADATALRAMVRDAARQGRRRRGRRMGIAAGALATVLVAGAGVAVATDGLSWSPQVAEPRRSVSFTMDIGFDCELRFSQRTGGVDPAFVDNANRILDEWYQSTDLTAAGNAHREQTIAEHTGITDAPLLEPGETWESLPIGEAEHRRWSREWILWTLIISDLEAEELQRNGIDPADPRFADSTGMSQIQCFDQNGELYRPGARS